MMSNWHNYTLDQVGTIVSGSTPSTENLTFWNGSINWVTPYDLSKNKTRFIYDSERKISLSGFKSCNLTSAPAFKSLIISSRAPVGYLAIPKIASTTNQGCKTIIFKENQCAEFYYYLLLFNVNKIKQRAEGTTFAEISKKELEKICFSAPDLPAQKRIAKILSTVDGQIEKTEAIIAKYQSIKQGMLHDLFTRGIDLATGKLRLTPEQAPELYKPSPLGLIPKAWEAMRIDQVAEITTGCKDTQNKVENGIYPFFVRSQHIESINSYSYDGEAILTAGDGVGVGKVFHYIKGKFDFHQRVYMLSNFKLEICGKYIFEFFKTHFLAEVDKYSAKTTVDSVRLEMIAGMLIPIAKFEEQILISLKINQLDKLIAYESINQNKLKNLKHGLMSRLLNGAV